MAIIVKNPQQFLNKKAPSVPLKLRIGCDSKRRYAEPVYTNKGKLKAFWCRINGTEEHHPEGVYYLRVKGKKWVRIGKDAEHARLKQQQFRAARGANDVGVEVKDPEVTNAAASGTPLKEAVEQYLSNVKKLKAHKTWSGYRLHADLFAQRCKARTTKSITKQDVLDHMDYLGNELGLGSRTVFNHYASIGIMLRSHGVNISAMLKRNEKPTYEEPIVDAYYQEDLEKLFKTCGGQGENPLVWEFFLGSGFREQEVEYFSPKDIDCKGGTVIARKKKCPNVDQDGRPINSRQRNRDVFKVKDREARAVPIPSGLMAKLMERQRHSTSKWVFPSPCGKPEGHFLRKLKMIAFRGGLNCGNCVNRKGLSCKTHAVCEYWSLHKFRRTFATSHHERRLLAFEQERVTFRWKDYAHGGKQSQMTLRGTEFLRRFFLHVLPRSFVRIRHFGFLANRFRASRLALCRQLLGCSCSMPRAVRSGEVHSESPSLWHCPRCGGPMIVIQRFTAAELSTCTYFDSS